MIGRLMTEAANIRDHQLHVQLPFFAAYKDYVKNSKSYSLIMDLLLCFFMAVFVLWIIVITDPLKRNISVYQKYMDFGGKPLFLTQIANFERGYFIVSGCCCVLFVLRILQIAKVQRHLAKLNLRFTKIARFASWPHFSTLEYF